jgi:pyridoxamine 5'-phosphate oxidase
MFPGNRIAERKHLQMIDYASIRKEYANHALDDNTINPDPLVQFETWFKQAQDAAVLEPNAMALATVDKDCRPSLRIVLLKGIEDGRFVFFSNMMSRKGEELTSNAACAATFFWPELTRQVRIEGNAFCIDEQYSERYFKTRPRDSQIGAWASRQSQTIAGRFVLEAAVDQVEKKFNGCVTLPKPSDWGGFGISPEKIEYWQGRANRLHDRILYLKKKHGWNVSRLSP